MPNPENLIPFNQGEDDRRQIGRPMGAKNRSTIARKILEMRAVIPAERLDKLHEIYPDMTNDITVEDVATIMVSAGAMDGDVNSYKAIMDSAYGAPKQDIEMEDKTIPKTMKVEIVPPIEE